MPKNRQQTAFTWLARNDNLATITTSTQPLALIQRQGSGGFFGRVVTRVAMLDQHRTNSCLKELDLVDSWLASKNG